MLNIIAICLSVLSLVLFFATHRFRRTPVVGGYRNVIGGGNMIGADDLSDMIGADPDIIGDEIVGDDEVGDEIVGDDEVAQPVIGARHRRRRASGKRVLHADAFMWRREFIGMTAAAATVAGGQSTVTVQPQRKFKTKRVVVISTIAAFFQFVDLKVGQNSQAAAVGNTPCQGFVENAVSCYVDFDTADIGNLISVIVLNTDIAPHTFSSVLFGIALRPQYS